MRSIAAPLRTTGGRPPAPVAVLLVALIAALAALSAPPARAEDASTPHQEITDEAIEPAVGSPTLNGEQEALAQTIFNELISPCCWTTTVAVHGSGAAPRIQAEVRQMIAGGMSHQQILDRYIKQYGERILAKPKKSGFNLAAYWVPYLAFLVGAGAIATTVRRRKLAPVAPGEVAAPGRPTSAGPDEEYRRRLDEELRRSS